MEGSELIYSPNNWKGRAMGFETVVRTLVNSFKRNANFLRWLCGKNPVGYRTEAAVTQQPSYYRCTRAFCEKIPPP